jgi:hypothetical protein
MVFRYLCLLFDTIFCSNFDLSNGTASFKNVNNCLNTNIYSYLETSVVQSSNVSMSFIFSTPVLIRHLWQPKRCFLALVAYTCSIVVVIMPVIVTVALPALGCLDDARLIETVVFLLLP